MLAEARKGRQCEGRVKGKNGRVGMPLTTVHEQENFL